MRCKEVAVLNIFSPWGIYADEPIELDSDEPSEVSHAASMIMLNIYLLYKRLNLDRKHASSLMSAYSTVIPKVSHSWLEIELRKEVE